MRSASKAKIGLSFAERVILRKIERLSDKRGFCYGTREWLAGELDMPLRTLYRYLAKLAGRGAIEVTPRGHHAAHTHLTPVGLALLTTKSAVHELPTVAVHELPTVAVHELPTVAVHELPTVADCIYDLNLTSRKTAAGAEASRREEPAAAAFCVCSPEKAVKALEPLGILPATAKELAAHDDCLALAVAQRCAIRFRRPVDDRDRYARDQFRNARSYRYEVNEQGHWRPPPSSAKPAATIESIEKRSHRNRQIALEKEEKAEERARLDAVFTSLSADRQQQLLGEAEVSVGSVSGLGRGILVRERIRELLKARAGPLRAEQDADAWWSRFTKAYEQLPEPDRLKLVAEAQRLYPLFRRQLPARWIKNG